jgi:hypothetical protein
MRDQLEKHLSALKHQGVIEAWHDRRIPAGHVFNTEIDAHLDSAEIILLLISSDFLASEYCYAKEMKRAMKRHDEGAATVIPVILRPCDWHDTPFGKLLAAPKDGKPITQWPNTDEAFLEVVRAIKSALGSRGGKRQPPTFKDETASTEKAVPAIRSSNLRVTKKFTELDKDTFVNEGFEFISKYFENSLQELKARNPGIDKSFRRIDADRFTSTVYRDGNKVCQCTVFRGGMMGDIAYAMTDDPRTNGMNESLSIEVDDQALYFRALGMQFYGKQTEKLSFEGAAEFFWSLFIRPIQEDR